MRTLSYIIGDRPKNRSDCLDYASKYDIINIMISLKTRKIITNEHIYNELYGVFVWEFSDTSIAYEEVFGNIFMHEEDTRQQKSTQLANERLANTIARIIERTGFTEINRDIKFAE